MIKASKKIYLDYASTTPVDPKVLKAMLPYFSQKFGNTVSFHKRGADAMEVVENSRELIAKFINAKSSEIIFTSSATESNNLALKGIAWANAFKGKHIIISSIEHDCVLNAAGWLKTQGFEITELPVDKNGFVLLKGLKNAIRKDTILVSIIHGNNEIGTIQNIRAIGKICRENNTYFHTDASQSFGKIPIDVIKDNIDLLTASSHKIYGPLGAALLYKRSGIPITPLLHGGGHEQNFRSSTVNLPAVIGFKKAVEICSKNKAETEKLIKLRDKLIKGIIKKIPDTKLNGDSKQRLQNNVNITFSFVEGESLLLELNMAGIYVSTGSACSSNNLSPSHVLMALGKNPEDAHGSIRFSLGRPTKDVLMALGKNPEDAHGSIRFSLGRPTKESDIDYVLLVLPQIVKRLRKLSPFNRENTV